MYLKVKTDREEANLLGLVRTVHEEAAELFPQSGEWLEGARTSVKAVVFDGEGNLLEQTVYTPDGRLSQVEVTEYRADGAKKSRAWYEAGGRLVSRTDYEYDDEGREAGCTRLLTYGLPTRLRGRPSYDGGGRKVEERWYYEDGTLHHRYVFSYDGGGPKEAASYIYYDDGALEERKVSTYDAAGRVREVVSLDASGQILEGRYACEYDDRGNEIEATGYHPDGSLRRRSFFSYETDSVGNWVKRLERRHTPSAEEPETRAVTYRSITYG